MVQETEKENLARVFKSFDINGDGVLDIGEVKRGYKDHYGQVMSDDEIEKLFKSIDVDNSGFIDYSEFVAATIS